MIEQPILLDMNQKRVRIGDVVRATLVIDYAGRLYTSARDGKVVDFHEGEIVVQLAHFFDGCSIRPWPSCVWSVVGHESFS